MGVVLFSPLIFPFIGNMASPEIKPQNDAMQHDAEKHSSFHESSSLILSEEQALAKARSSPDEALPIIVTYALDDPDNPRHWGKAKKWWISIFVSFLNVATYVSRYLLSDS